MHCCRCLMYLSSIEPKLDTMSSSISSSLLLSYLGFIKYIIPFFIIFNFLVVDKMQQSNETLQTISWWHTINCRCIVFKPALNTIYIWYGRIALYLQHLCHHYSVQLFDTMRFNINLLVLILSLRQNWMMEVPRNKSLLRFVWIYCYIKLFCQQIP